MNKIGEEFAYLIRWNMHTKLFLHFLNKKIMYIRINSVNYKQKMFFMNTISIHTHRMIIIVLVSIYINHKGKIANQKLVQKFPFYFSHWGRHRIQKSVHLKIFSIYIFVSLPNKQW
jgi:hypothetical protein